MSLRVISYGGGVQSTALLVLAVQGHLGAVDAALFANVGDESEHPDTLAYVRTIAMPWAVQYGVPVHELRRQRRDGTTEDLYHRMMNPTMRSIPIPVRMANGFPGKRACTADFKIKVLGRWLAQHGATPETPATVLIGFSWDEVERMGAPRNTRSEVSEYPLIDRRLNRQHCERLITDAGLPVPPKSACYFCPFHRPTVWARMRRDEPVLFWKAATLEAELNRRRAGKDPVWLTRFNRPLPDAVAEANPALDFGTGIGETCDEGYCWT